MDVSDYSKALPDAVMQLKATYGFVQAQGLRSINSHPPGHVHIQRERETDRQTDTERERERERNCFRERERN